MHAPSASSSPPPLRGPRIQLLEKPGGETGAGRLIERWLWLWRWETWAAGSAQGRRPRAGWSLTYRRALQSSQDALDDYEIACAARSRTA